LVLERNTEVESGLATKREEDTIRLFTLDNIFDVFGCDGEVVYFIGQDVSCLNSSDVWIYEDRADAGFFESFQCLGTCERKIALACVGK